jgi:hypothetical protein
MSIIFQKKLGDKFEIIRFEGFGYVKHSCNYDSTIFDCKIIYKFKIKSKQDSSIEFIEDYCDYIFTYRYNYNYRLHNLTMTSPTPEQNQRLLIKHKKSCLIL